MAKGDFFIKLMIGDWLNDPSLRALKRENRDTWLTVCLLMKREGVYKFQGTKEVLARKFFLSNDEFDDFIRDLDITGTADVTRDNFENHRDMSRNVTKKAKIFTIVSRRLKRDDKLKEQNRLRKQKQRGNEKSRSSHENVTTPIVTSYKSQEKEGSIEPSKKSAASREDSEIENQNLDPEPAIQIVRIVTGITAAMNIKQLPNKPDWTRAAEWAIREGFSVDEFLECYGLMKRQKWRNSAIKPMTVAENLPELDRLRLDVSKQNGSPPVNGNAPPEVITTCDICRKHDTLVPVRMPDGSRAIKKCPHDPKQFDGLTILDR